MTWTVWSAAGLDSDQPKYDQFAHGGCWVGCGPVAWAMLIAWADRQAAQGNAFWNGRWGLFRQNGGRGGNDIAPVNQSPGVENMIREIHDAVATFCIGDQGATLPAAMYLAFLYLIGRSYTWVYTAFSSFGIPKPICMLYAASSIQNRQTPAIIGTGWLSHYPLAFKYGVDERTVRHCFLWWCWDTTEYDRWFQVNNGWGGGGTGNEWVPAHTWFIGEIYPTSTSPDA
jgi:hypothetical protein